MQHALSIAGGSGSRLWPLSREGKPKQLLAITNGRSLLEEAWTRIDGLVERRCRWVCAEESWRIDLPRLLPGLEAAQYLGEPEGRDTLAVIARDDPDAIVAVFAADHVIEPREAADSFLAAWSDRFPWNSGMFLWNARSGDLTELIDCRRDRTDAVKPLQKRIAREHGRDYA